jgi:hypothetical protein
MITLIPFYQTEFVRIEVNLGLGFIQTTWLQQPSSSDLFRKETRLVMEYALEHHVFRGLFDVRNRDYLDMSDQNWLVRDIFPRLKGRHIRLAYLVSMAGLEIMDTFHIHSTIAKNPEFNNDLELDIFLDREEALKWLFDSHSTLVKH